MCIRSTYYTHITPDRRTTNWPSDLITGGPDTEVPLGDFLYIQQLPRLSGRAFYAFELVDERGTNAVQYE